MKDRKDLLFHLGIAISTANLLLLPVWWELLFIKDQAYYYMLSPPVRSDYLAAVAGTFLLSAILFFCARLARRTKITWLQTVTKLTFLLLLFIPLNTMRLGAPVQLGFGIWMARLRLPNFMIPVFLGALILSVIVIRFRRQTFKIILFLILSQLPFAAITIGQAFLKAARARDHASLPQSWSGPSTLEVNDERRLVWILFDELDESMLFSHRPSGLTLPAFDSFRKESVRSIRARAPSTNTTVSIPSLLTGIPLIKATPQGISDLLVLPRGESRPIPFRSLPNVFARTKEAGFQTTIHGWYHPYCSLFENSVDCCSWRPVFQTITGQKTAEEKSFFGAIKDQMAAISPFNRRRLAIDAYHRILENGKKVASRNHGLIFLHFPIPHAPVIYNRTKGELSTTMLSNIEGYVDNMALADRTLMELRAAMEKNGSWQRSAVIVSSDHVWRDSRWYDGRRNVYVPFLVKMPGQSAPLEVKSKFETIHTQELILLILKGELKDNNAVARWIEVSADR